MVFSIRTLGILNSHRMNLSTSRMRWSPAMRTAIACLLAMFAVSGSLAFADDPTHCAELMKFGIYDKYKTLTSEAQYTLIKSFFKNNQFQSRRAAESKAADLG